MFVSMTIPYFVMEKGSNQLGTLFSRAVFLLVLGVLLGVIVNQFRPEGAIPWVGSWGAYIETRALQEGIPIVQAEWVRTQLESGMAMGMDARSADEYQSGTIPGALSLPVREMAEVFPEVQPFLVAAQPVIVFCSGIACEDGLLLGMQLRDQGYTNVLLFAGGMAEWRSIGYPIEGGP